MGRYLRRFAQKAWVRAVACAAGAVAVTAAPAAAAPDRSSASAREQTRALQQLQSAIRGYGRQLSVPVDPARALRAFRVGVATREALTAVVAVAGECRRLAAGAPSVVIRRHRLEPCAERLEAAGASAAAALTDERDEGPPGRRPRSLDLWPVLRVEMNKASTTYVHDYALLFDLGGDDTYDNNAGSSLIDVRRGPAGTAARDHAPARGCEQVNPDHVTGGIEHPRTGPDCTQTTSMLVDTQGSDRYGVQRAPGATDAGCTRTHIVRRIGIQGAGVAGVGILRDESGDDRYVGKTMAQGAGHAGGVGVLHDLDGDDRYLAIRSAQGFGLVGGAGALRDDRGDDTYDFYAPAPLDPSAAPLTEGSGGVRSDSPPGSEVIGNPSGGRCDAATRHLQGAGLLGGSGTLTEGGGRDRYRGSRPTAGGAFSADGSQGFGALAGAGSLTDLGGRDRYVDEHRQAMPNRGDDTAFGPASDPHPAGGSSSFEDGNSHR